MLPWKAGTTLEYAYEDLTTKDLDERERTRSTSIATVRIPQVLGKGFVQAWSWRDNLYVMEEGDQAEEVAKALATGHAHTGQFSINIFIDVFLAVTDFIC